MNALWRRLRANLRRLRTAFGPMRQRGHGTARALLLQMPAALLVRAWRVVAQPINARLLNRPMNGARFARFQDSLGAPELPRLYVIVMPHTLHFLLPCLALLQGHASLVLVANGARRWERSLLRERLPALPMFTLRKLPWSSLPHGDVIDLLIEHHRGDFALIDHDAYLFDGTLLPRLQPAADECLVGVFSQVSRRTGLQYPLTHLLGFNAEALRRLMHRHRVDARQTRRAPARVAALLAGSGLGPRSYLKDYQTFHDTLHVLLAVALAEGLRLRFEAPNEAAPVMHVGGTSIGSHHTKNLLALYTHLRFIELLDDPLVRERYAFLTRPLRNADDALRRRAPEDAAWQTLPVVDTLIARLQVAGAARAFVPAGAATTRPDFGEP